VLGVSVSAILIRLSDSPSLVIAGYRMAFTVLILLPVGAGDNSKFKKFDAKLLGLSVLSGFFLALHFAVWISSLDFTSVASSTVIVTTQPIFVVIGSYLIFKERISLKALLLIVCALVGSSMIGFGDFALGADAIKGDLLALAGAIFIAAYMLIGRNVRQYIDVIPYTLIVYSSACAMLIAANLIARNPFFSYPLREYVIFILLAVFSTVFGHTIFNWAMKYISAITVSACILGEPIGATILAIIILKELPTLWQVVGGTIVLLSLYLFMKDQHRLSKE